MHTCVLKVQAGSAKPYEVAATFDDAEWNLLLDGERYAAEVDYLSLAIKDDWQSSLTITWTEGKIAFSGQMPAWNEVILVLHRLRPLILEDEPTYFHKVLNVLARRFEDDGVRGRLKLLKRRFAGRLLSDTIKISVNDTIIGCEETLKKYLNAYEFHRDAEKRDELQRLFAVFPSDAAKTIFVHLLIDKVVAVRGLELFIGLLTKKQESLHL